MLGTVGLITSHVVFGTNLSADLTCHFSMLSPEYGNTHAPPESARIFAALYFDEDVSIHVVKSIQGRGFDATCTLA